MEELSSEAAAVVHKSGLFLGNVYKEDFSTVVVLTCEAFSDDDIHVLW